MSALNKRVVDIVIASLGLIILSPVIVVIAWQVRQKLGSPIIFNQVRPGLNGQFFSMLKFRTMRDAVDVEGVALPDKDRITKFGNFLRATSLDELPGLINVLRGDMSIVGPRPLLAEYLSLYTSSQARRHEVKPGITGWAQVNGRNAISWEKKFQYDIWYVDNQSFLLDIKIILLTVKKVFAREGINAAGEATMSKFTGESCKKIAILGAGGHAKVVADTAERCGWDNVEIFDDQWPAINTFNHWPVVGNTSSLLSRLDQYAGVVVAIGNNEIRNLKMVELTNSGAVFVNLIDPTATLSRYATLGKGVVVFASVVVNAGACISDGAILNTACSVDHDCVLGECVHVGPGARLAGAVIVKRLSWIGIGASVKQSMCIGSNVRVGAGAAVVKDVDDNVTVVGVPAKPLKTR